MVSEIETVEMEVHQLLQGDVDTGLVCLSGADLDELVEANRALELENRALREFVRLVDSVAFLMDTRHDVVRYHRYRDARQRLAADHGLPLPEVEMAEDASDDEQHYGPVCSLCGAPILFAGFDLCTNCERGMLDD